MRILLVDDIAIVVHYLEMLLTQEGHSVITARSGEQALEILKRDTFINLVITDLRMPGISGVDLFKESQQIERITDAGVQANPEFILITGVRPTAGVVTRETEMLRESIDIGFVDVLIKPIDKIRLIGHVNRIADQLSEGTSTSNDSSSTNSDEASTRATRADGKVAAGEIASNDFINRLAQIDQTQREMREKVLRLDESQSEMKNRVSQIDSRQSKILTQLVQITRTHKTTS